MFSIPLPSFGIPPRIDDPGGRLVAVNVATNSYCPYIIPTAHLLLDYFTINGFSNSKVYLLVYRRPKWWAKRLHSRFDADAERSSSAADFSVAAPAALVVMAEKGPSYSTWDESPVQHQYRVKWVASPPTFLSSRQASVATSPTRLRIDLSATPNISSSIKMGRDIQVRRPLSRRQ